MRARSSRRSPPSLGVPAGSNSRPPELFRRQYGMQAGNIVGVGSFMPSYISPDRETGLLRNVTPFWMIGGSRRRGRGRHRDRALRVLRLVNVADVGRPSIRASSRPSFPARRSCSSASPCPKTWSSTTASSRMLRSPTTRSPACSTSRRVIEAEIVDRIEPAGRTAPRASARADVRRLAGHRQRDRGRDRRSPHRDAADARGGASRAMRVAGSRWRD